jgi:CPA2 family monovalent cation:H+ antiporter-2
VTLAELAITIGLLAGLGLVAARFGLSAIPAYLLAGLLLGPNEPKLLTLIEPSEVTAFVAELGLVFLLFFLGLEFSLERVARSGRHVALGGAIDLALNGILGLVVGLVAFGVSFPALVLAACIYVSSSAIAVKGLIDFRRLADDETDLVLGILVFEDLVLALVLGVVAAGGVGLGGTAGAILKAVAFVGLSLLASRYLTRPIDRLLQRLPLEFFLLGVFGFLVAMAAVAKGLGISEAIGALMAGIVLAETGARREIEERFFGFRDVFAAFFFFAFGLTIDLGAIGSVWWLVVLATAASAVGKLGAGLLGGWVGGFSPRQGLNAGAALFAHGEFTIILAQVAAGNAAIAAADRADLVAFAGIYVLVTATLGVVLMKESKRLGRLLFPRPPVPTLEGAP